MHQRAPVDRLKHLKLSVGCCQVRAHGPIFAPEIRLPETLGEEARNQYTNLAVLKTLSQKFHCSRSFPFFLVYPIPAATFQRPKPRARRCHMRVDFLPAASNRHILSGTSHSGRKGSFRLETLGVSLYVYLFYPFEMVYGRKGIALPA